MQWRARAMDVPIRRPLSHQPIEIPSLETALSQIRSKVSFDRSTISSAGSASPIRRVSGEPWRSFPAVRISTDGSTATTLCPFSVLSRVVRRDAVEHRHEHLGAPLLACVSDALPERGRENGNPSARIRQFASHVAARALVASNLSV